MPRTVIIGDIHGCYDELLELLDRAAVADDDVVVSVGDLVDRGPKPAEVIGWFRARAGAVVLMGNHERKHVRGVFSYAQEIARLQLGDGYADAVAWMRGLPYFYETGEVRVVHAALVPGLPLAAQAEEVLCGSTAGEAILRRAVPDGWWHEHDTDALPVVFGHHVVGPEPLIRDGHVFGIDTGACHGLRLTALSVPDFRLYQVDARADHWAQAKRAWQVPVLRTRPWPAMTWDALDEELRDRGRSGEPAVTTYLAEVRAWADALRAQLPVIEARIAVIADQLRAQHGEAGFSRAAAAHPAKPLLFLHARGRLDAAAVAARCTTPARTIDLADAVGLTAELAAAAGPGPK